jgi:hypothetical protein
MREASRAERTLRDAEWRPDRASAEAARGCIRFRQEPDTRTGVSSLDTPAMHESYSIRGDLTTPQSILPPGIPRCKLHNTGGAQTPRTGSTGSSSATWPGCVTSAQTPNGSGSLDGRWPRLWLSA